MRAAIASRNSSTAPDRRRLPLKLQAALERLSGLKLDDVRVEYNSPLPAVVGAHAFAQDGSIHLARGRESLLAHEAWHVVQQRQGRVRPTVTLGAGQPVNDSSHLEREADEMGRRAARMAAGLGPSTGRRHQILPATRRAAVIEAYRRRLRRGLETSPEPVMQLTRWVWNAALARWIPSPPGSIPDTPYPTFAGGADGAIFRQEAPPPNYDEIQTAHGILPTGIVYQIMTGYRCTRQQIETALSQIAAPHGGNGVRLHLKGGGNYTAEFKLQAMGDYRVFSTDTNTPHTFDQIARGLH